MNNTSAPLMDAVLKRAGWVPPAGYWGGSELHHGERDMQDGSPPPPQLHFPHCFYHTAGYQVIFRQGRPNLAWYSGVTLNVARPDMNIYATLGVMLY